MGREPYILIMLLLKPGQVITKFRTDKNREIVIRVPVMTDLSEELRYINELVTEDTYLFRGPEHNKVTAKEEKKWLKDFLDRIKKDEAVLLSCFIDAKLIAGISLERGKYREAHVGEIGIAVAKDFREEGIGQKLFTIILEEAKKRKYKILCLHVFANNLRAIHVYEKFGFIKTGVLPKGFFHKGKYIDQVLMYKELVNE